MSGKKRLSSLERLSPLERLSQLEVRVRYPAWVDDLDLLRARAGDEEKMSLAIEVSRRNVTEKTGGPFGSAIFDRATGEVLAVGMNLVVPSHNSTLHAEMVAFQMAEARLGTHSLGDPRRTELFTSCEPCAMCLGATLWSGVSRLVTAAKGDDARAIGFDEGPVFAESYRYLAARGVEIVHDLGRTEAQRVLELYRSSGGLIYNGVPAD